jgi:hypothetical protein
MPAAAAFCVQIPGVVGMSAAERPVSGVAALRYGQQMDVIAHEAPGPDKR